MRGALAASADFPNAKATSALTKARPTVSFNFYALVFNVLASIHFNSVTSVANPSTRFSTVGLSLFSLFRLEAELLAELLDGIFIGTAKTDETDRLIESRESSDGPAMAQPWRCSRNDDGLTGR